MRTALLSLLCVFNIPVLYAADWQMKRLADFGSGLTTISNLICGDFEHDGLPELTFVHFGAAGDQSWQVWEYGPLDRYRLARADTWPGFEVGTYLGGFFPMYAGEADDGKAVVLGVNTIVFAQPDIHDSRDPVLFDSVHYTLCLYKSRTVSSCPDTLVWLYDYGEQGLTCDGAFPLDRSWCGILRPFSSQPIDIQGASQFLVAECVPM